ncbi:MAG: sulfurtransferase [Gammaproteobacteria bacterium]|nr:MAG: sulfurtransferase [Gammaproteobacteria bacterium]
MEKEMKLQTPLVSTDWLEEHLGESGLRIYDVTLYVEYKGDTGESFGGYNLDSETPRKEWEQVHLPDSDFIDINAELFDSNNSIPFMMPTPEAFAAAIAAHGVADGTAVVLFSKGCQMWATRVWWMLRSIGFDNVTILDGGWEKWQSEGRPTDSDACNYPTGNLSVNPRPEMWVDKHKMLEAIEKGNPTMVNALPPEVYTGELNRYGRPGHLPGSYNVSYDSIINSDTGEFLKPDELRPLFADSGSLETDKVIAYCGGGISATMDCLAMSLCGQNNVSVYDGSMNEWVLDESLPLKLGSEP